MKDTHDSIISVQMTDAMNVETVDILHEIVGVANDGKFSLNIFKKFLFGRFRMESCLHKLVNG